MNTTFLNSTHLPSIGDDAEVADYEAVDCEEGSLLDQEHIRTPIIAMYIIVFAIVLCGNAFTIIVICIHRSMRTATNFFLANLAFADMLVAFFCILQNMFHIVGLKNGQWPLGETVCKLYVLFLHLIPCTSIGILVCVSLEKYIAVLHPLMALKLLTNKLRVIMMIITWVSSIAFNLPYYFTTVEKRFFGAAACTRDMTGYGWLSMRDMITASFVVWFCMPLATIGFLYTRIGLVLWQSGLKPLEIRYSSDSYGGPPTLTINYEVDESNNNSDGRTLMRANSNGVGSKIYDDTHMSTSSEMFESRKKIIRLLIAIVCSFALLTLPHHARLLYTMWTDSFMCNSTPVALLQPLSYLALFMSSGVNPILYAFMSQRFREAVRDIIKCRTGANRRKHTRTRTFVSDLPEASRSPSLLVRDPTHYVPPPPATTDGGNMLSVNGYSLRVSVPTRSSS
uniref:G_PROTEIN_RECEP_F1_2 domain-containing protein n=1 Tax=Panagrellus redivivus TaxID=6233 RepID=A0A7E4W6B9_PANRE